MTDLRGELTFINPAALQLLGYTSEDELLGHGGHAAFHHSYPDGTAYRFEDCPLSNVRLTGRPVRVDEDGFWRKDGTAMPVSYASAPVMLRYGRGSVVAFRDITEQKARELSTRRELEALSWVGRIRYALGERRFVLYAQPIIELATGETVQHELLVRLVSPAGEVIAPAAFLPVVEAHNLVQEIDRQVFTMAMTYAAAGHRVAVNMSADSLSQPGMFRFVEEQLARNGVDPRCVVFEVTETGLIHNEGVAQVFIENAAGSTVGSGWMTSAPATGAFATSIFRSACSKIDQEFVQDLDGASSVVNRHVIQAIVTLARGMDQHTVAEGIETESTLQTVRELGVDYGQGYYIARPAPADNISIRPDRRTEKMPENRAQKGLDTDQGIAGLEQALGDRQQAIGDREQENLDQQQAQLDDEIEAGTLEGASVQAEQRRRQVETGLAQTRCAASQDVLDDAQRARDEHQTLLDEQQVDLDAPPETRAVDPITAERRRADQLLARADAIEARAEEGARRAKEARARAQAAIARATATATDHS